MTSTPHTQRPFPRGLYGVTPEWDDTDKLLQAIRAAHAGGMSVLQWRRKDASPNLASTQLSAVIELCNDLDLPLIINDQLELALQHPVAGLHLGKGDGSLPHARQNLHSHQWLGASCYNELGRARQAIRDGVDYVAFGALFPSKVKSDAVRAELQLLSKAREYCEAQARSHRVAIVAIGGITPENARHAFSAGADAVAVISSLFEAEDITAQAQRFVQSFEQYAS